MFNELKKTGRLIEVVLHEVRVLHTKVDGKGYTPERMIIRKCLSVEDVVKLNGKLGKAGFRRDMVRFFSCPWKFFFIWNIF